MSVYCIHIHTHTLTYIHIYTAVNNNKGQRVNGGVGMDMNVGT